MDSKDNRLSPELLDLVGTIKSRCCEVGLDPFTTLFELVDYKQLNEIAAYGGFPTRYPHWRWGMEYERISKSYTYGLSVIYEMVINNDPCYAYLLRANNMAAQKTVIAHVFGHSDFFKNNYWFSKTNRKMLDQMANHASVVRKISDDVGQTEVENFIDTCLSIENLIDIHVPFNLEKSSFSGKDPESETLASVSKLDSKPYMDSYVNPNEFLDMQRNRILERARLMDRFPEHDTKDVLGFLLEYAPLNSWQRRILSIVRQEAYYFAPQAQTKILNEGWATYWHSKMMTELSPLEASEIIDYCDQYAGVVANQPGQINPYRLGVELLRHVEERWDKGRFGKEYLEIDDPRVRESWDLDTGLGREKIFEVRAIHNDISFIDAFLDEDFCRKTKLFLYDFNPRTGKHEISARAFSDIKSTVLKQLTNLGMPIVQVVDGNFMNRAELLLQHVHDGVDLKIEDASEVLVALQKIWARPVHLETILENVKRRLSFDGSSQNIEKV